VRRRKEKAVRKKIRLLPGTGDSLFGKLMALKMAKNKGRDKAHNVWA
jgi:hypothetical protein